MSATKAFLTLPDTTCRFQEWGEEYGGVYSLKFGSGNFIILYEKKAIHDLMDKKGLLYAERPKNYVADIITSGDSIVFAPNTVLTREKRRIGRTFRTLSFFVQADPVPKTMSRFSRALPPKDKADLEKSNAQLLSQCFGQKRGQSPGC